MTRSRFTRFVEAIKAFLLSKRSREALVFTFFVIISAIFWLMMTLNDFYDLEVDFPIEIENVEDGTVIISELPEAIHVTLHDKGTELFGYYFRRHNPTVKVDFAARDKGGAYGHVNISHAEIQRLLTPLIDPSSRVVGIRPDTLEYFFTRGGMKRVKVAYRGGVQVRPELFIDRVYCDPDSVTVWGEAQFLDSLTVVPTVVMNFNDVNDDISRKIALMPMRGVKFDPAEVTLVIDVDKYVEKKVEVPIIGTNFPGGMTLRTFPAKATVSFNVGIKDYDLYTSDNFVITATYEELMDSPDSLLQLKLRSVPEGITQVKIMPEFVEYLIEQTEDE